MVSGELSSQLREQGLRADHEVYVRGEVANYGAGQSLCSVAKITAVRAEEVSIR